MRLAVQTFGVHLLFVKLLAVQIGVKEGFQFAVNRADFGMERAEFFAGHLIRGALLGKGTTSTGD